MVVEFVRTDFHQSMCTATHVKRTKTQGMGEPYEHVDKPRDSPDKHSLVERGCICYDHVYKQIPKSDGMGWKISTGWAAGNHATRKLDVVTVVCPLLKFGYSCRASISFKIRFRSENYNDFVESPYKQRKR